MTAIDMAQFIVPRSDQLNADDLLAGPRTITITGVKASPDSAEQPISIHFQGDDGKPFKPCKSMRRVMVHVWGSDGNAFIGKSMTLYRDEKVAFGGIQVGGIRISHMSHIDREVTMALTATRAKRSPYTVRPLPGARGQARGASEPRQDGPQGEGEQTQGPTLSQRADSYEARLRSAPGTVKLKSLRAAAEKLRGELDAADPERLSELDTLFNELFEAADAREHDA